MADKDLFSPSAEPPTAGLLVTNHLNLMYMLAAGLVMPPTGFEDKYYTDTLECFPGWVPLFINDPPREAIEMSTRETEHLKPAIVEIDLSGVSGKVMAISANGVEGREFPHGFSGSESVILVPAPVPVSRIKSVLFRSLADKKACEADAKDFGNVPLMEFDRKIWKQFNKAPSGAWPPTAGLIERKVSLQHPFAAGAVMAMLLRFANLGDQAVRTCRIAFDSDESAPMPTEDHPILAGLGSWIVTGEVSLPELQDSGLDRTGLQNVSQARLFWEGVERLMEWREAGRQGDAESVLLDHLARSANSLDVSVQKGVQKLRTTLKSLTGLTDASPNEMFERHPTPLAHAMTLFFLRDDCADLYDYRSDRLAKLDWLVAAILFGIRDGWMRLPLRLRADRALSDAVSHRMARLSHRIADTGLDLGDPPPRVRPLRESLGDGQTWRAREKRAALELAKMRKWDCVHTRIDLRAGEYRLIVKGNVVSIEVPGEPRISPEVDHDRFFGLLAEARLDSDTEKKIRKTLGD